jgi:hypothetical protein
MLGKKIALMCLFALVLVGVTHAQAAEVRGKAIFEQRKTVVPMIVCEGEDCPKPKPYWVLVVKRDNIKYELDRVFALGSLEAPDAVDIVGVSVPDGSDVVLEGSVRLVGKSYGIISDVQRVAVLGEPRIVWTCESVTNEQPALRVDIFSDDVTGYEIRLFAVQPERITKIDAIAPVAHKRDQGSEVFEGGEAKSKIEVRIGQAGSELFYQRTYAGSYYSVPFKIVQPITCEAR